MDGWNTIVSFSDGLYSQGRSGCYFYSTKSGVKFGKGEKLQWFPGSGLKFMQGGPLLSFWWAHGENGLRTGQPGVGAMGPYRWNGPLLIKLFFLIFGPTLCIPDPSSLVNCLKDMKLIHQKFHTKCRGIMKFVFGYFLGVGFSLT